VRCFAHTVQLGVKQALTFLNSELNTIRKLILTCKSGIKRQQFDCLKIELGFNATIKLPRYDTPTRWSSTYEMASNCFKLKSVFNALCNTPELDLQEYKLNDYQWTRMKAVITFLQRAAEITKYQSSTSTVTLSMVPGMYTLLTNHCKKTICGEYSEWTLSECKDAAQAMLDKLESYKHRVNSNTAKLAKLLDPRFKSDISLKPMLYDILINQYGYGLMETADTGNSNTLLDDVFQLEDDGDDQVNTADEVDAYFEFTRLRDVHADPLSWWRERASRFPTIAKPAQDLLAIPATSVPCEQTFSLSGQLVSTRRASLLDDTIEASMLCRNWMQSNIL